MKLEKYSFNVANETRYDFYSEGPKGKIKKVVIFSEMAGWGLNIFNLGFGDWNEASQDIDDLITTDNNDREKVLATVAEAMYHFVNLHPNAIIFIKGSTPSRTRLYQIAINLFLEELTVDFRIYGFYNESWESFSKGKNYEAFLARAK
jgi:hypothetical protein